MEKPDKDMALHAVLDRYEAAATAYPQAEAAYEQKLADWKAASASGSAAGSVGSPAPRAPIPPLNPAGAREPGALFNGMISPLLRYPVRGVLWYQGETDTADAALYRELFPAMIAAWRKAWGETEFPFLYVQLPGFLAKHAEPSESRWAELREAQASALAQPKTGMAVNIDLGDEHNMHPANKQEVAHRLTLIAQAEVYGKSGVASSGPVFTGMEVADGKAVLSFSHSEGLNALGGPIKGLAIAGADGQFVWADAQIHNGKVIAQSKDVPKPVAVRYDWADMPEGNLFNEAGLPAAPFRTDDWVAGQPIPTATPAKHPKHHSEE
jgi:sialate O-acetylesterase